ncbi:MAG: dienelactone hydrolase family protein [Gemmataceae bacterium]
MRLGAVLAVLVMTSAIHAEFKVTGTTVKFKSGSEDVVGFLAQPEGEGPFPAIVVIQEWWGLNDWIKIQARRLAAQGYVALAPDLYRGKVTEDMKVASQLLKGLPPERALRDLKAATDYLANHKAVNKDKLAVIGWCMGGGYALELSVAEPRLRACIICYGRVTADEAKLKPLQATVLGVFGKEDKGIPIKNVRAFGEALKKLDKKVEALGEYEAGHGFMRESNGSKPNPEYREAEAKKAWAAIESFLKKELANK